MDWLFRQIERERVIKQEDAMKYRIIWPEDLLVSGEQLISWAKDDVANGLSESEPPTDAFEAILILQETGTVTFGENYCGS